MTHEKLVKDFIPDLTSMDINTCETNSSGETSSAKSCDDDCSKKPKSGMFKKFNIFIKNVFSSKVQPKYSWMFEKNFCCWEDT